MYLFDMCHFQQQVVKGDLITFQQKPCVFERDTKLSHTVKCFTFGAKLMVIILY